jgi:hypothetical protein
MPPNSFFLDPIWVVISLMPLYSISFAAQSANFLLEGQKVGDEGIKEEGE